MAKMKPVHVRLGEELLAHVQRRAEADGTSVSMKIRDIILEDMLKRRREAKRAEADGRHGQG